MQKDILDELEDKKIVILGFGREGKATYEFLRKHFNDKELDVIDENIDILSNENKIYTKDMNLNIIKTSDYLKMLEDYDYIFKTPGISFKGKDISKIKDKITSELDMFIRFFKDKVKIIGITGTKGKSTTSSMLYKILNDAKINVHFLGNIGIPIFLELDMIKEDDVVVIEISSHQSQYINYSPNIGVILNVYEEHLDHYNSYDEYIDSKINVIKYQNSNDTAIYLKDSYDLERRLKNIDLKSKVIKLDIDSKRDFKYFDFEHDKHLLGEHNNYNIMIDLKICEILGIDKNIVCNSVYEFLPLEHRLEKVGNIDGVMYYNDSISTIPETAIACINTLKGLNTIIIGGLDRGVDYSYFEQYLINSNLENIICMYATGKKIYKNIKCRKRENLHIYYADNLEAAVDIAKKVTKKGTICAMSPAAASYGDFENFEQRGKKFKEFLFAKK